MFDRVLNAPPSGAFCINSTLLLKSNLTCSKSTIVTLQKGMKKVNNRNTRATSMTSSGVFIANFEHISHLLLVFLLLTLNKQMLACVYSSG